MKIVATGIIQSGKFQKLAFDPSLLRRIHESEKGLKEQAPKSGQDFRAPAKWYRGKTKLDEYLN